VPEELVATVWGGDQVLCEPPPDQVAVRLWAEVARDLIGSTAEATVSIDCDDSDTETRLRVAGFNLVDVDPAEAVEVDESLTLEREGQLGPTLEQVLRLPPEAPLGALAIGRGRGVDLDLGVGLDIWGDGALEALRRAAPRVGIMLRERPAEEG
jgi:hypothetical protein